MARFHSYVNLPMGILGLMHSTTSKEALHARISWNWLGCWQIVAWILYFSGPFVEWVRLKMGGWPTKLEVYNQPVSCDVRACIANKITFGLVWKLGDLTAKEDQASFSAKFKRKGEHFIRPWKVRDATCGFVHSKPLRIPSLRHYLTEVKALVGVCGCWSSQGEIEMSLLHLARYIPKNIWLNNVEYMYVSNILFYTSH